MGEESEGVPLFVVAVDGSEASEKALTEAMRQAGQLGAELALVMVVVPTAFARRGPRPMSMDQLSAELEVDAADTVHAAAKRVKEAGLKARTRVLAGEREEEVGPALAGYAEDHGAAMIFVGSRGRKGASREHLGSVAEGLQAVATCVVCVVR